MNKALGRAAKPQPPQPVLTHAALASMPAAYVRTLEAKGILTRADIRMIIPDRTLNRRIAQDQLLTVDEADGIARLLRVHAHAMRLYDDRAELAGKWLRSPNPALGDAVPMQLARTDMGAREVEIILGRMEYGVFS